MRDLLVPVVSKADRAEGQAALELYARRIYRTHVVSNFSWHEAEGAEAAEGARGSCGGRSVLACYRLRVKHGVPVASEVFQTLFF